MIIIYGTLSTKQVFTDCKAPYPNFSVPPPPLLHSTPRVQQDKSFTFVLKTPPASVLLKKAAGVPKGAAQLEKVGSITKEQLTVSAPNAQLCEIHKNVTKV